MGRIVQQVFPLSIRPKMEEVQYGDDHFTRNVMCPYLH